MPKKLNGPIYSVPLTELYPNEIFVDVTDYAIPGVYDYYQVSNYGRIWHKYLNKFVKYSKGSRNSKYYFFSARTKYGSKNVSVHRTVAMCFGSCPVWFNYLEVNHMDGNTFNNNINNLEWCTRKYNIQHSYDHNLHPKEDTSVLANINSVVARQVCELLATNQYTNEQIANMVGNNVSRSIVSDIKQGRTWKSISKDYNFYQRPGRILTDEQVEQICQFFQDNPRGDKCINDLCRDALVYIGLEPSDRYVEALRKIYVRKHTTNISSKYNF